MNQTATQTQLPVTSLTLVQQQRLVVAPPSVSISLTPTTPGNRLSIVVVMPAGGSVLSVTDDGGNQYTLLVSPTVTGSCEVWQATAKASASIVTVVTTEQVTSVTVSEIAPQPVNPTQPVTQPAKTQQQV